MAYDIGTARGVIEMEYNGRGIDEAKDDLGTLDDAGKKSTQSMSKASAAAGKAGLVVAAGLAAGVAAAANFEQRMSAIEAVSGATAKEMDSLSDKALQLGADTSFSAGEAASAMEELVKAGLSVDDVLNGAADATVALAAAGEIALPEAATIASNALNQFGLKAENLPNVADLIAGAANASAISVSDLGQSMTQAGAVANLAGLSFEDTATAIALMGNAGIKGSDAGTSLKSMLSRLQPTTVKQNKLFKELGILTEDGANKFYDAEGNLKSFDKVSQVLSDSLEGMTNKQKQATLQTLFGSDAIRAAAIMAKNGAKGFNEMGDAMNKTTAADVAATRLDNFKGSMEAMMGSLETLGITLGTILLPGLRNIVDAITSLVNWFANLGSGTQKAIVFFLTFVATALLITAAVLKIIIFIGKFQAALVALRGTMIATWLAALGPIGLIIAAVIAVIAVIVLLWNKSETFKSAVLAVWSAIKTAAAAVASWFMGTFLPAMVAVWNGIVTAVKFAFNLVVTIIRTYIQMWITIIRAGLAVIKAVWGALWRTFAPIIKAVFGLITAIIRLAWTIIRGLIMVNVRAIQQVVRAGFNAIKAITSSVMNSIRAIISAVWGFIGPYVRTTVNTIKSVVTTAWNAVKTATSTVFNSLKGIVSTAISAVLGVIRGLQGQITGIFSGAASWLYSAGQQIIQGLINGISSMIGKVTDMINSVTDKVSRFLPGSPVKEGPLKVLNKGYAGKQIVQMAMDGIESMAGPLARTMDQTMPVTALTGALKPTMGTPTGTVRKKKTNEEKEMSIDGTLVLANGEAYISGVATRVVDDANNDSNRRGRMNYDD